MNSKKLVGFEYHLPSLWPSGRSLEAGVGVASIKAAEFRVRNAVAGNRRALESLFNTMARQALAGGALFGPFLFVGKTGTGKTTMIEAIARDQDPRLFVEFDLSTCKAPHEAAAIFGAPPGYQGWESLSGFAQRLKALNETLYAYDGIPEEAPLPVLCFDHIDEAHPQVLAALTRLITTGFLKTHNGTEIQLGRCVVILTMNGIGEAVETAGRGGAEALTPSLQRVLGDMKGPRGEAFFRQELLERGIVVPFFETSPRIIAGFIATEFGREVALALGLTERQAGRIRYSPYDLACLWAEANKTITSTASVRHLIEAQRAYWSKIRSVVIQWSLANKGPVFQAPPKNHVYLLKLDWEKASVSWELAPLALEVGPVSVELPLPYLERTCGMASVQRSDYWTLGEDFEARLGAVITGQPGLLNAIAAKLTARLTENGVKPMLSFIVTGPTGTGKTALGKAISAVTGQPEVFCDCNTWKTEVAVFEGIFGKASTSVASQLRANPASVIVFDEVDKAHPKFWDFYMTVGDTGQIVDSQSGQKISLRHAVIELTSNYLADRLDGLASQAAEKSGDELDPLIRKALAQCAAINPACLERLDLAGLMMPVTGPAAYPMWNKFVLEKLTAMKQPVEALDEHVAMYLENRHADKGGSTGARARERTCATLLEQWGMGSSEDFQLVAGTFCLSAAGRQRHEQNPTPRSERQRFWQVTPEKVAQFKANYKGNDQLVDSVLDLIREESMKVKPRGPVGVVFAVGPTGSGKSYLGKALAQAFGKGEAVEIKCAQCKEEHTVSPFLFSAPAGYQGAEKGGQLTTPMLTRKDRVIIFDEIDKAHPSMLDQLLNVLDEGSATDMGSQLPVDLKQCFILLTSNLAADELEARLKTLAGKSMAEKEAATRQLIEQTKVIAPEKLARFQRVFAVTYATSYEGGGAEIEAAIHSVLAEYDQTKLRIQPEVIKKLAVECQRQSLKDVRAMRRLIQTKLAPALIGTHGAEYVIEAAELRLLA